MKKRTRSREVALQYLYMVELRGKDQVPSPESFLASLENFDFSGEPAQIPLDVEIIQFALDLIQGCLTRWEEFEEKIKSTVKNFEMHRVFPVDRAILRIALFELSTKTPPKVTLNEAIELGKKYSTEKSGSFINGVLEKLKNTA